MSKYPPEIVDYACDPRTGLARRLKWLPTIAEIVEFCEERVSYAKTVQQLRRIAEQKRAIIGDTHASDAAKDQARAWLDNCETLKRLGA